MGPSEKRSGEPQGQKQQQTAPDRNKPESEQPDAGTKRKPKPESTATSAEFEFRRTPGAVADLTISSFGIQRNEAKIVKTTDSDGFVSVKRTSYNVKNYDVAINLNAQTLQTKREYCKTRWVQILIKVAKLKPEGKKSTGEEDTEDKGAEAMVLDSISSLGSDFSDLVINLVVTVELPFLSNLALTEPYLLENTPGYMLVEDVVQRIKEFKSLEKLHVVLNLPHTFTKGLHELQLAFVRPFYELSFTKWVLHYMVPGMVRSERVSREDVAALHRYHLSMFEEAD